MTARLAPLALALASCGACHAPSRAPARDAAPPEASSVALATAAPVATRQPALVASPAGDGGLAGCKTLEGPARLARPGPYVAVSRRGFVDFYANAGGSPALAGSMRIAATPGAPALGAPPVSPADTRGAHPACAAAVSPAGAFAFCMNPAGEIRRFRLAAGGPAADEFLARARAGGPVAAASLSGHPLVAFTRERTTSEGLVSEAWVQGDDGDAVRLSEDGAGATTLALAPRGSDVMAVYVDARRGMAPVHARALTLSPKLTLGPDAVLFIGGGAETGTRVAAGASGAVAYALLPVAHDLGFGLATAKIEGAPKTDGPVAWSDYPNGLDPAPVAATTSGPTVFVARARPSAAAFGSPRVLELGELDASAKFVSLGVLEAAGEPVDVALADDGAGGFVVAYTARGAGWAERLSCEKPK